MSLQNYARQADFFWPYCQRISALEKNIRCCFNWREMNATNFKTGFYIRLKYLCHRTHGVNNTSFTTRLYPLTEKKKLVKTSIMDEKTKLSNYHTIYIYKSDCINGWYNFEFKQNMFTNIVGIIRRNKNEIKRFILFALH